MKETMQALKFLLAGAAFGLVWAIVTINAIEWLHFT